MKYSDLLKPEPVETAGGRTSHLPIETIPVSRVQFGHLVKMFGEVMPQDEAGAMRCRPFRLFGVPPYSGELFLAADKAELARFLSARRKSDEIPAMVYFGGQDSATLWSIGWAIRTAGEECPEETLADRLSISSEFIRAFRLGCCMQAAEALDLVTAHRRKPSANRKEQS